MNRILVGLVAMVAFVSCKSATSFEKSKDKASYLKSLASEPIEKLHELLKKDTAFINTMVEDAKATALSISFGISGSSSNSSDSVEAAQPFFFNVSKDSAMQLMNDAMAELEVTQDYEYPNSVVKVNVPRIDETGMTRVAIEKMFLGNNEVKAENISMKTVDSASIRLSYRFPTGMDTFIVAASATESVGFEGHTITIDEIKDNAAELQMPQSLYSRLLGYQAINTNGVLMNSNSNSAFPVTVIKRSIIKDLEATNALMIQALQTNNATKVMELLSQIPQTVFEPKNRLLDLKQEVDSLEKNQKNEKADFDNTMKIIKDLMAKYIDILHPEEQSVSLKFPDKISSIYFYIGKDYDSISSNGMAYNLQEKAAYNSYKDTKTNKYGVIDSAGNIIIKASYDDRLSYLDGNYFVANEYSKDELTTYYLDAKDKKLIPIKYKKFLKQIDATRAVFTDSMGYASVLENNEKVLLPFAFDNIEDIGNLYVVKKSLRGRDFCQILKANGDVLEDKLVNAKVSFEKDGIIVFNKKNQCGLMNAEGKYLIPMQELELDFVGKGPLLSYTNDYGLIGLMDSKGNKVTEAVYYALGSLSDGLILAEDKDYVGFIYADGRIAIPLQYLSAEIFVEGLALVTEKNGRRGLIDMQGKMVKEIPASAGEFKWVSSAYKDPIYIFDNANFDTKGNQISGK